MEGRNVEAAWVLAIAAGVLTVVLAVVWPLPAATGQLDLAALAALCG